ncbi:MAG: hypothetical protein DSY83_03350, partial [Flavobacteriia bacterium]
MKNLIKLSKRITNQLLLVCTYMIYFFVGTTETNAMDPSISRGEDGNEMAKMTGAERVSDGVQFSVSGNVVDETGTPLPGASIVEKGSQNGTQTDFDGNFTLEVSGQNAVLEISYMGYNSQEVALNGRTSISVVLQENAQALSEVVVTALGIKSDKRALGYATAQVDGDDISGVKATNNFVNSLSGKVAGVQISSTSRQPGSG